MTESNFSKNSTVAQEHDFEQQVVSIGSHGDNDIVLAGSDVLPFHATAVVDGEYCRLIPMEPAALILVDGAAVGEMPVSVEGFQQVEIGNHVLFFQRNGTAMRVLMRPIDEKAAAQYAANEGESTILLNVFSGEAEVDVEQTAVYEFEVVNAGPIVASFYVTVKGCPAEWVEISPDTINLNEGQRRNVEIQITPPRDPSSHAGTHPIEVIVHSPNYGGQRGLAELSLTIHPYYEYALGNLSPKNQRIRWRKKSGMTYLPVTNMSNGPADFSLMAMDDENGCTFDFCIDEEVQLSRQATTKLATGETAEVPIQITPTKNPMFAFRNKRYHYTTNVSIPQNPGAPQVLSGSATSVPLFGWWSIMLTIAAFVIAAFFVLQPNIRSFDVAAGKDVIELGDTTKLLWDVSPFATRLSISNVDEPITRGQFSETVAPEQSTTYELVSGNWLSGMFKMDKKETVTVLVVPPSPQVNVFDVDERTIAKGEPINVRWSIKEADKAILTIDEVEYPLTSEEFSGEREVVLEKDALVTLLARNASGSELQSYFVNVVPPYIDIHSFTVWVRPDEGTTAPADDTTASVDGAGKALMSKTTAPDPNFPVKFVELVADPNSETGYRVVFNSAIREELAKGEQVILEWNVAGVESLEIAPFTDALPAHGSQPAFPQESMNFVMTAQSGELQGIYMLPIKVFDGEPPEAPTIEFFTASPSKMEGAGDSEFAWSVSGEWSRVQLSSGEEIIADYLNPQGFKTISIDKTKNILLTAWNGDLSSSKIIEIVVDPALIPLNLEISDIQDHSGFFYVGDTVNVFIEFTDPANIDPVSGDPLPPSPYPTGMVTITDGYETCIIDLPLKYCKDGFTFNAPGDPDEGNRKTIIASYSGDDIYAVVDSAPYDKQDIIVQANTVSLAPAYFNYYDTEDGVETGTVEIKPLHDANLRVGDGLFIDVAVRAANGPLTEDEKGQVIARYCPLNTVTNQVDLGNCVRTLPATIEVTEVGGVNIGHGKIAVPHLQEVGTYQMLISYSHLDGAYEATLLEDPDSWFEVKPALVHLWPDGLAGCNQQDCKILSRTDDSLYFFGKIFVANVGSYTPLFATYPQPEDEEANPIQVRYIYDDDGVAPLEIDTWADTADGWDDSVDHCTWASTDVWRLECDPVTIEQDGQIAIDFADDNYVTGQITNVSVKEATEIFVNPEFRDNVTGDADANNRVFVGEAVQLQQLNVYVKERDGLPIPNDPTMYLAMDNNDDIGDVIKVIDGTCSIRSGRLEIDQINPLTDSCRVYFKNAGIFGASFIFEGNDDYDQSTESLTFNIQKQQIEVDWERQGGGSLDTTREAFENIDLQLNFACNDTGENCDDFQASVLPGTSVHFDLSDGQDCTLSKGANELDDGDLDLAGTVNTVGTPPNEEEELLVGGLSVRCKDLGTLTVDLQFADPSDADFDIPSGSGDSQDFEILQKDVTIVPEVRIVTDTSTRLIADTGGTGDDPGYLGNNLPADNADDEHLWVGEQYLIYASFPMPDDADPTSNDVVVLNWPAGLDQRVDYINCLDNNGTPDDGILELPLKKDTGAGVWEVECVFKPTSTNNFSQDQSMTFKLDSSYSESRISASQETITIDEEANIKKRPVTISDTVNPGTAPDIYARTNPELELVFTDGHYQLDAFSEWTTENRLDVTWNSSDLTCNESGSPDTLNCDIPDDEVVDSDYSVSFTGSSNFANNTSISGEDLNIVAIPVELVSVTGDFPEEVSCQWLDCVNNNYGWPNSGLNVAFKEKEYRLDFVVNAEVGNETVEGFVKIVFGWPACPITPLTGYKVDNACTFKVSIEPDETATFRWKFTSTSYSTNRSFQFGYGPYDDVNKTTVPFTKGTSGWGGAEDFKVYEWLEFTIGEYTNGIDFSSATGGDLSGTASGNGYTVYIEYPNNGGDAGFNEIYLECEGHNPCWGDAYVFQDSGETDGRINTGPDWDLVVDRSVPYQVILKGDQYLGWIQDYD